ncbi:hypothetical protein ACWEWU_13125 [Staphylococcus xylosus]
MRNHSSYTKFTDKTDNNFDQIISRLDSKIIDTMTSVNGEDLIYRFNALTTLKSIQILGNQYSYKVYNYYEEILNYGYENDENRDSRVSVVDDILIVFSNGHTNQYIINRSFSDSKAKFRIRSLMNYSDRGEVIGNDIAFLKDRDFYLWVFYVVLNNQNNDDDLQLESIEAYKGNSLVDTLTNVSGSGGNLINLLSTLTFIFEIDNITKIRIKTLLHNHKYEIELIDGGKHGNVKISLPGYEGDFDELESGEKVASIVLKVMLEALPKLSAVYSNFEWSKENFKKDVGDMVIKGIEEKLIDTK